MSGRCSTRSLSARPAGGADRRSAPGRRPAGPRPPPSSTCARPWTGRPARRPSGRRRPVRPAPASSRTQAISLGRPVGRLAALAAVGEVGPHDRQGEAPLERHQRRWSRPLPAPGNSRTARPGAAAHGAGLGPCRHPASRIAGPRPAPPGGRRPRRGRRRGRGGPAGPARGTGAGRPCGRPGPCRAARARRGPAHRVAVGVGGPVVVPAQARQVGDQGAVDRPDPAHRLADRLHDDRPGPERQLAGGVHGGQDVLGRRAPSSSISNDSSSPSPRSRWTLRWRPIRSVWRRWRRRGWGMRIPASSWRVRRSRSSNRSGSRPGHVRRHDAAEQEAAEAPAPG